MLVKIYTENPSEKEIDRVVNLLERDGVVIYPTDSVYAFGCSIRSAKAVERLRRIKGKDLTTFSVVFDSLGRIADYCRVDNAQGLSPSCWMHRRVCRTRRSNGAVPLGSAFRTI